MLDIMYSRCRSCGTEAYHRANRVEGTQVWPKCAYCGGVLDTGPDRSALRERAANIVSLADYRERRGVLVARR